jgi:beta-glucanase (GH16 family)
MELAELVSQFLHKKIKSMNKYTIICILSAGILLCHCFSTNGQQNNTPLSSKKEIKEWKFEANPSWADEFNNAGKPDPEKWSYDIGGSGWGNNELQYYTDELRNAASANGYLTITAIKEKKEDNAYTSARLVSKNKGDFLYGRIEASAKLPAGRGTWPAIWMLPTDWEYGGWPKSGEIDIMEHVGYAQDTIHISTHCEAYVWVSGTQKTAFTKIENVTTEFHKYRVDWTPDYIKGYIDDELIFTNIHDGSGYKVWPFDKRFHVILNVAIGGGWGGQRGIDDLIFPTSMTVDYVRYYKLMDENTSK